MIPRLTIVPADAAQDGVDSRPIVLLAEPDRLRAALITASLEDAGIAVAWAPHGDAALASAEEIPFDAHIVDPSLTSARGERVVAGLVTEHPRVPMVLSGHSATRLRDASARIPPTELVGIVRVALAQRNERGPQKADRAADGARELPSGE